jgi:uncharacterized cupredoxin-like copper-binding protein
MNATMERFRAVGITRFVVFAAVGAAVLAILAAGTLATRAQNASPTAEATCPGGTPTAGGSPTTTASPTGSASPTGELCVTIEAYDLYFNPNVVTIPANQSVTVMLKNDGAASHDFSVTDHNNTNVKNLNISVDLQPGQTQTTTINAPAGTYYFFCNVPGHEQAGMFGYLIVKEGAAITTEEATVTPPSG